MILYTVNFGIGRVFDRLLSHDKAIQQINKSVEMSYAMGSYYGFNCDDSKLEDARTDRIVALAHYFGSKFGLTADETLFQWEAYTHSYSANRI